MNNFWNMREERTQYAEQSLDREIFTCIRKVRRTRGESGTRTVTLSTDLLAWSLYRGALGVGEMCSWRKLREGRLARLNGEVDRKWRAVAVRRVAGDTRAQDKHEREGLDLPKYLRGLNEVH